ncbi:hypothetical protein F503_02131 [Ophiostoma piceae UAMH 11346]|uniref:Uncharacterized protein n=1 Tax=Ophiostoma piceae (strain UAMH 11346) TaxID=1262450 RepID=S3BXW5_OPHP1|nr:hypothetical protein F503_02131 [Ophiostoma piceae UAMH 11346]
MSYCYTRARKRTKEAIKSALTLKGASKKETDVESLTDAETLAESVKPPAVYNKYGKDKKHKKDDESCQPATHYGHGQYSTPSGYHTERTSRSRVLVDTLSSIMCVPETPSDRFQDSDYYLDLFYRGQTLPRQPTAPANLFSWYAEEQDDTTETDSDLDSFPASILPEDPVDGPFGAPYETYAWSEADHAHYSYDEEEQMQDRELSEPAHVHVEQEHDEPDWETDWETDPTIIRRPLTIDEFRHDLPEDDLATRWAQLLYIFFGLIVLLSLILSSVGALRLDAFL